MVLISWIDYVMLGFAILLLVFLILLVGRFLHALLKGIKNPQGIKQVLRDRMLNLKTLVHVMVCFVLYTGVALLHKDYEDGYPLSVIAFMPRVRPLPNRAFPRKPSD